MNGNQLAMIATTLMLALPRLPDIQLHAFPLQPYFESNKWPPAPGNGFKALWERDFPLIQQLGANTLRIYPLLLLFHLFLLSFGTYNTNPTTRQFSQEYPNIVPLPLGKNHTAFMGVRYNLRIVGYSNYSFKITRWSLDLKWYPFNYLLRHS